jgi:glycosyltransferase involved in cell wall biosynthesis
MRILFIAPDFPWPTRLGTHMRSQQVIETLAGLGQLDLFSLVYPNRPEPCVVPSDVPVQRTEIVTSPKPVYSLRRRLRWLAASDLPLEVVASQSAVIRSHLAGWVHPPYDLVWVSRASTFELLGRPQLGPTVVDFDDLEDQKIRTRLRTMAAQPAAGPGGWIRRQAAALQAGRNASRWARLQSSVARSVETVVLCSQEDVDTAGLGNAVVVPNGYEAPRHPVGRLAVGQPPVILFQGSMRYGPNTDGARWFVQDIAPLVRRQIPGVQIRLVGDPDGVVMALDHPPEVTVVGVVESMETELARADLVVAPLRYASGTRLKILEAMAHRIPVVSTDIGAQGLGLEEGRHLLVADTVEEFAQACVSALTDPALRERLVDEAQAVFLQNHQWSHARARIRALALRSPAPASSGPGSP